MRNKRLQFLLVNDRGQALALTAAGLVVILGFAGLAIDMGALRHERRLQQTAADAAAIAGATQLQFNVGVPGVTQAAKDASAQNEFTDGTCNPTPYCVTMAVNNGPLTGPHTGNSNYVEAIVSAVHPTYFMKVFGVTQATVSARAVATLVSQKGGPTQGCVYSLGNPSYCAGNNCGISFSGTGTIVNASTCGFFDNGNLTTNGSPTVNVGTVTVTGQYNASVTCPASYTDCVVQNAPPTPDPLASLTPPTPCPGGVQCVSLMNVNINAHETVDFTPGVYPGTTAGTPVVYVVGGNGLRVSAANSQGDIAAVRGTGVTFYIQHGNVNIDGSASVQLSAPTSGPYAGILFYQNPADTGSNATAVINGNGTSYFQGALYFPTVELDFGGTSANSMTNTGAAYTVLVANNVVVAGNPSLTINSDYSSLPNGTFLFQNAVLVE